MTFSFIYINWCLSLTFSDVLLSFRSAWSSIPISMMFEWRVYLLRRFTTICDKHSLNPELLIKVFLISINSWFVRIFNPVTMIILTGKLKILWLYRYLHSIINNYFFVWNLNYLNTFIINFKNENANNLAKNVKLNFINY